MHLNLCPEHGQRHERTWLYSTPTTTWHWAALKSSWCEVLLLMLPPPAAPSGPHSWRGQSSRADIWPHDPLERLHPMIGLRLLPASVCLWRLPCAGFLGCNVLGVHTFLYIAYSIYSDSCNLFPLVHQMRAPLLCIMFPVFVPISRYFYVNSFFERFVIKRHFCRECSIRCHFSIICRGGGRLGLLTLVLTGQTGICGVV